MRSSSSLSEDQRRAVVALFEQGFADRAAAAMLGLPRWPVRLVYHRWRVRGEGALVQQPKRSYSFEVKLAIVQQFLSGEGSVSELTREHDLSSPQLLRTWVRAYRREGEDALRPKPRGRPRANGNEPAREPSEVERLRAENERLQAENAYLKKLRALRAQGRQ
jgi:transposase